MITLLEPKHEVPEFEVPKADHLLIPVDDEERWESRYAPDMGHVRKIFAFVRPGARVLVHCEGGISRSTAVGLGLMVFRGMTVDSAMKELLQQRGTVDPNVIFLQLIDTHLQMGGKFYDEVRAAVKNLPKDLILWCNQCQVYFVDGQNCPGKHWL
ncbi:MAG: dual specificity protein phosphatase family protein [Nitrososphaerales archaeon]